MAVLLLHRSRSLLWRIIGIYAYIYLRYIELATSRTCLTNNSLGIHVDACVLGLNVQQQQRENAGSQKKNRKTRGKAAGSATDQDQNQSDNDKTTQSKTPKERKAAGGSSSVSKKRKVQGSWGPMPGSTITAVENILDLVILETLALKRTKMEETQKHLNVIKNRFLGDCVHLKVPLQKQNNLIFSSQHHQEEVKKSELRNATLDSLTENLKAVDSKLEMTEEQIVSLQQTCSTLRDELEEEEEKAKQILQTRGRGVLKLSSFPSQKEETTLESRLREIVPECDCETMAQKLGAVLQQPATTQEAQDLLLQAQKRADQLFPTLNRAVSD